MWILEKKLPARGVKFYFITKQDVPEKVRTSWQEAVSRSGTPLSMEPRERMSDRRAS